MAFLGSKKNDNSSSDKISSATIITSCMTVTGNLKGSDTVHIDGTVNGDIIVDNTLVIGKMGVVHGEVKAKNAIINGELEGSIICDTLEVMSTGKISKEVQAKTMKLDGLVKGNVIALERVEVMENGNLKVDQIESKVISVHGSITGKIVASELLDIGSRGSVEGEISVKSIKTAEGGKMIGTMSTYEERTGAPKIPSKPAKEKEA